MVHFHTAKHSMGELKGVRSDHNLLISIETPEKSENVKQLRNRYHENRLREPSPLLRSKAESIPDKQQIEELADKISMRSS